MLPATIGSSFSREFQKLADVAYRPAPGRRDLRLRSDIALQFVRTLPEGLEDKYRAILRRLSRLEPQRTAVHAPKLVIPKELLPEQFFAQFGFKQALGLHEPGSPRRSRQFRNPLGLHVHDWGSFYTIHRDLDGWMSVRDKLRHLIQAIPATVVFPFQRPLVIVGDKGVR